MGIEPIDSLEQILAQVPQPNAPSTLRESVLVAMQRELKTQRRLRRLERFSLAILLLGIALNWSVGWHDHATSTHQTEVASGLDSRALVEVAVAISNATDAETGSRLAKQLAVWCSMPLSPQDMAAMEEEIQRRVKEGTLGSKEGSS